MSFDNLEPEIIPCPKCKIDLIIAKSAPKGNIQKIIFHCDCGGKAVETFIGFPFLGSTDDCYFDIISESEYACHKK